VDYGPGLGVGCIFERGGRVWGIGWGLSVFFRVGAWEGVGLRGEKREGGEARLLFSAVGQRGVWECG